MDKYVYTPPTLTVDSVIFQLLDGQLAVLLLQRAHEPFKDWWALPGGYCNAGETTTQAMTRVLEAKTGVESSALALTEQLYAFDTVARDPRGHAVSITYMALGKDVAARTDASAQNPTFFALDDLPNLAYDHKDIIQFALERLRMMVGQSNAVFALLPKQFTLSQLQMAYEAVLGKTLDKRNFRKKFLSFELLDATDEFQADGAHRPAQLYRFSKPGLQTLTRSFE